MIVINMFQFSHLNYTVIELLCHSASDSSVICLKVLEINLNFISFYGQKLLISYQKIAVLYLVFLFIMLNSLILKC